MSYAYQLRTMGVSPSGAEQSLLGEPLTDPSDRTMSAALSRQARSKVYQPRVTSQVVLAPASLKLAGTAQASMQRILAEQRVAALKAEIERLENEIEYWTGRLTIAKSRLKSLFVALSDARKSGSATAAVESDYAKLIASAREDVEWIEHHLDTLRKQLKALRSKLAEASSSLKELLAPGGVRPGGFTQVDKGGTVAGKLAMTGQAPGTGGAMVSGRTAVILTQLAELQEEIDAVTAQLERRLEELSGPLPPPPPESAGPAAVAQYAEMIKHRQATLREEIARLQKQLSELHAKYVELLAQL